MKIILGIILSVYMLLASEIEVGCNHYRPYVDIVNGKIVGSGYEIAKDVLNKAGVKFKYKVLPWARVYHYGLYKKNYMIGCLGRTDIRENKFQWIGPMEKGIELDFWALKTNHIKIKNLNDLKKYKIACIKSTYAEQFLVAHNFPKKNIKAIIIPKQLIIMLKNRRVDFVLSNIEELSEAAKKLDIDVNKLVKKAFFGFKVQNYLAFSKSTPKKIVEKVKKAYKELQKEGKIDLK